jgi:hypothetical protein
MPLPSPRPMTTAVSREYAAHGEAWQSWPCCFREPESPKVILMAKSEIRAIHIWQAVENLVCQGTGHHENDFASSIKSVQEPIPFPPVWHAAGPDWPSRSPCRHRDGQTGTGATCGAGATFGAGPRGTHGGTRRSPAIPPPRAAGALSAPAGLPPGPWHGTCPHGWGPGHTGCRRTIRIPTAQKGVDHVAMHSSAVVAPGAADGLLRGGDGRGRGDDRGRPRIIGGTRNVTSGQGSVVSGGQQNEATGEYSSVSGGRDRTAVGDFDWVAGSLVENE